MNQGFVADNDFEFFTFFTGLKQKELDCLVSLFDSFPYFYTHKITVLDNSRSTKKIIDNNESFYYSERAYMNNPTYDIDLNEVESVFKRYKKYVNRVITDKKLFHGDGINMVMNNIAKSKFVVVMDSDITFKNRKYLIDVMNFVEKYNDDLLAVGQIFQSMPFHLTLDDYNHNILLKIPFRYLAKRLIRGRFPQIIPVLLCVNRDSFIKYNMSFDFLHLDVYNTKDERDHKLFGDNGSSFLFQCALVGKQVVNVDIGDYVIHRRCTAVADYDAEGWNWFGS